MGNFSMGRGRTFTLSSDWLIWLPLITTSGPHLASSKYIDRLTLLCFLQQAFTSPTGLTHSSTLHFFKWPSQRTQSSTSWCVCQLKFWSMVQASLWAKSLPDSTGSTKEASMHLSKPRSTLTSIITSVLIQWSLIRTLKRSKRSGLT